MGELTEKNFGLVIAYLLPGFVTLWGLSHFSPTIQAWLTSSQSGAPSMGGFLYVTLGSLALGLTVSAVRWMLIDTLHHATGVRPPAWEFAHLDDRLQGFLALVENHYRYYQFYANMLVAASLAFAGYSAANRIAAWRPSKFTITFIILEVVLLAGSRDALRKYYSRAERLLGTLDLQKRSTSHDERVSRSGTGPGKAEVCCKETGAAEKAGGRVSQQADGCSLRNGLPGTPSDPGCGRGVVKKPPDVNNLLHGLAWEVATMLLFKTEPHAEHEVALLEDAEKPEDRIYEIRALAAEGHLLRILGSEIASLCGWWGQERLRPCESIDEE